MINSHREEFRRYAWDYFEVHTAQRMTTFNFYIAISTAVGAGVLTCLNSVRPFFFGSGILGAVLLYLSFVFYRLEERNKALVKNAEDALRRLDDNSGSIDEMLKLFDADDKKSAKLRKKIYGINLIHYSYSDCFRAVFLLFGILGLLSIVLSVFVACDIHVPLTKNLSE